MLEAVFDYTQFNNCAFCQWTPYDLLLLSTITDSMNFACTVTDTMDLASRLYDSMDLESKVLFPENWGCS